jgi:hypothetical protein
MQLDQVINQNAELVQEFATTGKLMNESAKQLQELMEQFKTEKGGGIPAKVKDADIKKTPEKTKKKEKKKDREIEEKSVPQKKAVKEAAPADDFFRGDEGEFEEF